jgi:hypothetical protein
LGRRAVLRRLSRRPPQRHGGNHEIDEDAAPGDEHAEAAEPSAFAIEARDRGILEIGSDLGPEGRRQDPGEKTIRGSLAARHATSFGGGASTAPSPRRFRYSIAGHRRIRPCVSSSTACMMPCPCRSPSARARSMWNQCGVRRRATGMAIYL